MVEVVVMLQNYEDTKEKKKTFKYIEGKYAD